jgi:hypothetical protein
VSVEPVSSSPFGRNSETLRPYVSSPLAIEAASPGSRESGRKKIASRSISSTYWASVADGAGEMCRCVFDGLKSLV